MGPKPDVREELTAYYDRVENDVIAYLDYRATQAEAADRTTQLVLELEPVEPTPEYLFYLDLKLLTGGSFQMSAGGYFGQPIHLQEIVRRCAVAERKYEQLRRNRRG